MAPVDLGNVTEVTRTYNWRGKHTGYHFANAFIPRDKNNIDARALSEKIAAGDCIAVDPDIKFATPTYGRKGSITGYDTDIGFIPADPNNALFIILQEALEGGSCALGSSDLAKVTPKIAYLVFCVVFDWPWPHLIAEFWRSWKYRPHDKSDWRNFIIRLSNIPAIAGDLFGQIAEALNIDPPTGFSGLTLISNQKALMEIEVPVTALRSVFKGERTVGLGWTGDFVEDSFQQNLVRSGRTLQEGPEIEWLLAHAPEFMSRPLVDVANGVISSFRREYGSKNLGYLSEDALRHTGLVLAKRDDGSKALHRLFHQPAQNFQLKGEWKGWSSVPRPIEFNRQLNTDGARLRIAGLLEAGFPLEAMAVANGYFELIAMQLALVATTGDQNAQELVARAGYMTRVEIIHAAMLAEQKNHLADALSKFIAIAKAIYPHRNDFMHELRSRDHEHWRTSTLKGRQDGFLIDHFQFQIWIGSLSDLVRNPMLSSSAISAAQTLARSLA